MKYRTIVADPPWPAIQGMDIRSRPVGTAGGWSRDSRPPYEMQSIDWIRGLPVDELAEGDAHLYLWIPAGLNRRGIGCLVAEAWGFNVVSEIVWCKPCFGMGKFPRPQHEIILVCRRGSLPFTNNTVGSVGHWAAPRTHSQKPEAFLDVVETASPGPYLELFARRNRFGWDTWGNECRNDVEMVTT